MNAGSISDIAKLTRLVEQLAIGNATDAATSPVPQETLQTQLSGEIVRQAKNSWSVPPNSDKERKLNKASPAASSLKLSHALHSMRSVLAEPAIWHRTVTNETYSCHLASDSHKWNILEYFDDLRSNFAVVKANSTIPLTRFNVFRSKIHFQSFIQSALLESEASKSKQEDGRLVKKKKWSRFCINSKMFLTRSDEERKRWFVW